MGRLMLMIALVTAGGASAEPGNPLGRPMDLNTLLFGQDREEARRLLTRMESGQTPPETVRQVLAALETAYPSAPGVTPLNAGALHDDFAATRERTLRWLGSGAEEAPRKRALLVRALTGDPDPDARAAAAEALGKLGSPGPEVYGALERALREDPWGQVQRQAARALAALAHRSTPERRRKVAETLLAVSRDPGRSLETAPVEAIHAMDPGRKELKWALERFQSPGFPECQREAAGDLLKSRGVGSLCRLVASKLGGFFCRKPGP